MIGITVVAFRARLKIVEFLGPVSRNGIVQFTLRIHLKSLKDRQTCGIDPIIGKPRKNSLDRVSSQASEFPVINAERESASEYLKA
jgi:hypothetical protein